ncbi:hypothetical protein PP460_gp153 [Streptomyces phage Muntaha]|uniref:Uncharacterized protein n=1 Tax=Streptomyces phage Muntaha TaxID=2713269 RepID=A0A6G8R373_9CAUD|nr:hypothetical protein PP460_gp153 [Streptomyces phage Muntaha]QIN94649.1 hypothetical protein SEA_MUNTAHA_102 [Streptomyces phage Muntaha]
MEDATLDDLIEMGVYEVSGVDEDGEPMYSLNVAVAKELAPEIYWADLNACETAIFDAVEAGYLEWDVDPDTLEMSFYVTELGEKYID